jgi:lipopolysaccharide export system permease protein
MQFLWKYVDDLVGKGLGFYLIIKLLVLATVTLVPMALPLAILLASIMTFGNLAENHELVSMKSAGMSLPRIMASLVVFNFLLALAAFFFSNNVLPVVNLKMGALLYDVRIAKPALNIQQDVFYNGIEGYSIRVAKKDADQETMHNIMIYDHTSNEGNTKVILAKSGKMKMSSDKHYLVLSLTDGNSYQEMIQDQHSRQDHPNAINSFKEQTVYMDLSSFKFSRTNEELFKNNYDMMDMKQLSTSIDSMVILVNKDKSQFYDQLNLNYFGPTHFSNRNVHQPQQQAMPAVSKANILDLAITISRNAKMYIESTGQELKDINENLMRRYIEWHRKITFSFACFILFFIGAPLGAIIKKGGLGMPVVVSALFFVLFYVLAVTGEKFAREGVTSAVVGMWMPTAILFPVGIFFTIKATRDSALFDRDAYIRIINGLLKLLGINKAL